MPDSPRSCGTALLLAAAGCLLPLPAVASAAPGFTGPLDVHLRHDRMTLQVAKAPQVYLAGSFNDAAVQQVRQLLQSGKLSPGTDVYLDSSTGDVAAGVALGELFRDARINTHLGTWRSGSWRTAGPPARPATCLDACAYAYLGGVYRWSPSGADRIGLHQDLLPNATTTASGTSTPTQPDLRAYLEAMGVSPQRFAQVTSPVVNGIAWWNADKMAPWQVANNGRLPLVASYRKDVGAPELELSQDVRGQRNMLTLQCTAGQFTLDARYTVGAERARMLAARAMYAYFEIDGQPWQPRLGKRPQADGDALVFRRAMPFAQLESVLHTGSLAAWIEITGSPVRLGFWLAPADAAKDIQPFLAACQALQPGYVAPKPTAKPAKPSFWKRIFDRKP